MPADGMPQFNVHPMDSTQIDELPWLRNSGMTVYSWVGIQTQFVQLKGEFVYLEATLSAQDGCERGVNNFTIFAYVIYRWSLRSLLHLLLEFDFTAVTL